MEKARSTGGDTRLAESTSLSYLGPWETLMEFNLLVVLKGERKLWDILCLFKRGSIPIYVNDYIVEPYWCP